MELTKGQINQAACSSEVEGIYYCDEMQQDPFSWMDEASQISTAAAAAGSISLTYQTITGAKEMRDAYNYTGEGVKVGILEGAVPDKTNPVFAHMFHAGNPQADRFHIVKQTNNTESGHVTSVAAIIAAETETFSAIAPDVDLYCAGVQDAVTGAIRWKEGMEALLDAGVNIINASYSLIGDTWGEYGDSSRWVDHVIWEHNVSVCIGSGNNRNVISGAMAYNAITVGNIDDQKRSTYRTINVTINGIQEYIINQPIRIPHYSPVNPTLWHRGQELVRRLIQCKVLKMIMVVLVTQRRLLLEFWRSY